MDAVTVIGPGSLFRAGLVSLLSTMGFERIDESDDIKQLRRHVSGEPPPDMLVVALARGSEGMVSAVHEIRTWVPTAKIVFVAAQLDLEVMSACFAAGANGYLLESISRDALRESLRLVGAGEKVFPSELASLFPAITSRFASPDTSSSVLKGFDLSCRELEILQCLANGQSNKVIAKNLDIAEATVKVHVKRILRKTNVSNRTQAALWGVATGVAASPASRKAPTPALP